MISRRQFIQQTGIFSAGAICLPSFLLPPNHTENIGIQLYSVRNEMLADATGTLKKLAALGFKQIESAGSEKGHYYGLTPKEMKSTCADLGMTLSSGHIHLDEHWQKTLEDAVASGQEYLICSSLPTEGQTIDNYKKAAEAFNKAGEEAAKAHIRFGYHNHDVEFQQDNGQLLYEVLLKETDPQYVHMELDLGWVYAAGFDPVAFIQKHPKRFELWHLKDMDPVKKHSTELGRGGLPVAKLLAMKELSGLKYCYVEQEEYAHTAFESLAEDLQFLKKLP